MKTADWTECKAIIVDPTGTELTAEERALFSAEKPAGFILFRRNCVSRAQVKKLVADLRGCVGRADAPVLIDQEGGSVARLKEPEWPEYPAAKMFGQLAKTAPADGVQAATLNSYLMAQDLAEMGITVNCAPVVDVPAPDCHAFLSGSRTYSESPGEVARLGEAVCRGLLQGGVTPVIKHIPGHGRAKVDSHLSLPVVDNSLTELRATDFNPFKYLSHSDMKTAVWAMAAHVVYSQLDSDSAATVSVRIVQEIVREEIGFEGVLLADDISMKALGGTLESRVEATMAAGMDLTMLCNASFDERKRALLATPRVTPETAARLEAGEKARRVAVQGGEERPALRERLEQMMRKIA